jgi:hypothetical protein
MVARQKGYGAVGVSENLELPVEYDSDGRDTGVEREQQQDDLIHEPFDPAEIDVLTRTMTVDLLLSRLRRGVLDLAPDFQRSAGIWSEVNQSKLIESLLLRIPLPHLYAAETGEEGWAVVDGIQRLTAIARFVDPEAISAAPLRLRGLEYLSAYDGRAYDELPGSLQTRINETELIVHLIRAGTPEPVKFNIFARLNTGGLPLTRQELRHALIPGRARDLLRELAASSEFRDATRHSVSSARMADREMVLRFMAFRLTEPKDYPRGDLDTFLRHAMKTINALAPVEIDALIGDFGRAMWAAQAIFGEHAFRKRFPGRSRRLPINKALFETISVNLAAMTPAELDVLESRRDLVQELLLDLMGDDGFQQAISVATGDVVKVRRRFDAIQQLLAKAAAR